MENTSFLDLNQVNAEHSLRNRDKLSNLELSCSLLAPELIELLLTSVIMTTLRANCKHLAKTSLLLALLLKMVKMKRSDQHNLIAIIFIKIIIKKIKNNNKNDII